MLISIHALREEGDLRMAIALQHIFISIHALREEGDSIKWYNDNRGNISIHALREEGDGLFVLSPYSAARFLSTPSARRATLEILRNQVGKPNFYPRPPRGGRRVIFQR